MRCRSLNLLRQDGLKVWFDEWECPSPAGAGAGGRRPGESRGGNADRILAKIEDGLERSRVLPLAHRMGEGARRAGEGCISANAFGSDPAAAGLVSGTLRFRNPLNKERRFLPLRLDDAPIKGSLAQFLYINWRNL